MHKRLGTQVCVIIATAAALWAGMPAGAASVGTAFTYQGQLKDGGSPASGSYDFDFRLFDAATNGNPVGSDVLIGDLPVNNGLFTASLDFGSSVFSGTALWLEIGVRPWDSAGPYTTLTPRQALTATPYALYATAPWITSGSAISYSAGRVGIGTAAPNVTLDVQGPAAFSQGTITALQTSGSPGGAGLLGKSNVVNGNGLIGEANGASAYGVWGRTDSGKAVVGNSNTGFGGYFTGKGYFSDKVGIGTAAPVAKLDVQTPGGVTDGAIQGIATADYSWGIQGIGQGTGVYAIANGDNGTGLHAVANGAWATGVFASADDPNGKGVWGFAQSGRGVYGESYTGVGVFGSSPSGGFAGYFDAKVHVNGVLSKLGGSFKIDHPLDPAHKYLSHSFVESPDMKNIYDGVITTDERGYATVRLPAWFDALNRDFRYQLTVIDGHDTAEFVQAKIVRGVTDNAFTLRTSQPSVQVCWQVTGIRKDAWAEAHRIAVEEDKVGDEDGKFLRPELFGADDSRAIDPQARENARRGEARQAQAREQLANARAASAAAGTTLSPDAMKTAAINDNQDSK